MDWQTQLLRPQQQQNYGLTQAQMLSNLMQLRQQELAVQKYNQTAQTNQEHFEVNDGNAKTRIVDAQHNHIDSLAKQQHDAELKAAEAEVAKRQLEREYAEKTSGLVDKVVPTLGIGERMSGLDSTFEAQVPLLNDSMANALSALRSNPRFSHLSDEFLIRALGVNATTLGSAHNRTFDSLTGNWNRPFEKNAAGAVNMSAAAISQLANLGVPVASIPAALKEYARYSTMANPNGVVQAATLNLDPSLKAVASRLNSDDFYTHINDVSKQDQKDTTESVDPRRAVASTVQVARGIMTYAKEYGMDVVKLAALVNSDDRVRNAVVQRVLAHNPGEELNASEKGLDTGIKGAYEHDNLPWLTKVGNAVSAAADKYRASAAEANARHGRYGVAYGKAYPTGKTDDAAPETGNFLGDWMLGQSNRSLQQGAK